MGRRIGRVKGERLGVNRNATHGSSVAPQPHRRRKSSLTDRQPSLYSPPLIFVAAFFSSSFGFLFSGSAVQAFDSFVDIHCHLLPGVDDGASTWQEALAMARLAAADGIGTVVVTPHQWGGHAPSDTIRDGCRRLQVLLGRHCVPLRVVPGAEVRIEPDLVRSLRAGEVLTLADLRRYVLLELPHELFFPLNRLLCDLQAAGLTAILSHPERNRGFLAQPRVLEGLVEAGCLLQVTAGSLVGSFGPQVRTFAEGLVAHGLVHFVATDGHGANSRRPLMSRAFERVASLAGRRAAAELCSTNPASVVANRIIERPRPKARSLGLASWLRWGKAG